MVFCVAHFLCVFFGGLESHASLSMLRDLNGRLQLLLQYDAKVQIVGSLMSRVDVMSSLID